MRYMRFVVDLRVVHVFGSKHLLTCTNYEEQSEGAGFIVFAFGGFWKVDTTGFLKIALLVSNMWCSITVWIHFGCVMYSRDNCSLFTVDSMTIASCAFVDWKYPISVVSISTITALEMQACNSFSRFWCRIILFNICHSATMRLQMEVLCIFEIFLVFLAFILSIIRSFSHFRKTWTYRVDRSSG